MKRLIKSDSVLAANHSRRNKNKRNSKDITNHMIRVRSSNMWGYAFDIDETSNEGTLYIQFKNETGGPGDIYRYYEVPLKTYQKLITAPSKGHYFWKSLRNNFQYSKLTGDKLGKLKNAVNYS